MMLQRNILTVATFQFILIGNTAMPARNRTATDNTLNPGSKSIGERVAALKNLKPYVALGWQASPAIFGLALLLRAIRAFLPIAILYVGKLIIDDVALTIKLGDSNLSLDQWLASGKLNGILVLLGIEFVLAMTADVLGRVGSVVDSLLSERLTNTATVKLMTHAATLDLQDFEDPEFQDKLDRARHQTSGGMTLMLQLFNQAQTILTVVSFAAGLMFYAPWIIVLLFVTLLPSFLGESHFNTRGYALDFKRANERREMEYVRQVSSSAETAKEVKIFELNGFLVQRYLRLANGFYAAHRYLAIRRAGWGSLFSGIGTAGYYLAYTYIVWRTVTGSFSIGDLTFLAASFQRLRGLLEGMLAEFSSTAGQALYLSDLFSFFETAPRILSPAKPVAFPQAIRQGFEFQNVGFKYPGGGWAMRHLNFELRAGEVLAIVGENGAGKTTLAKLLTRLYDPTEGRILLDGRDLRDYDPRILRDNISVIFQDFVRYSMTVSENIAVGKVAENHDEVRIRRAAGKAQADKIIAKLERGYDQMLGKRFLNGVDLSGGEWQRIAIARAYNRQGEVLILDEPTAALDARSEFEVFQRFKDLSAGKTAVLISHRLSSVRMADRILVLANGEVEAVGTHEELISQSGRYAELFELQAAGYR
jgi:ATP-binding cassette, subfamily B, bacterial